MLRGVLNRECHRSCVGKIVNVVGARPNLTKIASLMEEMSRHPEIEYPLKAGQRGVGHVRGSTACHPEFSHPSEHRPPGDCGRNVDGCSRVLVSTAARACAASPTRQGSPQAVGIVSRRRWSAATAPRNPGAGKPPPPGRGARAGSARRSRRAD